MLAVSYECEHLFIHLNEAVLRQGLFLLPFLQGFLNFVLKERRLDGVDNLNKPSEKQENKLTLNRNFRFSTFLDESSTSGR